MNKKVFFISISVISVIVILICGIVFSKNKAKWNYQLEVVREINYMLYSENNKFGVINKGGEVVVDALYDEIQIPNPSKPLFICMYNYDIEKNQYNIKVLNDKSEQILYQYVIVEAIQLNPTINEIPYEKSVLKYMQNGKYGLIDFQGNVIVKAKYEEITSLDYKEGMLVVKKDGKYGVININGATIVKEEYDLIESDGYYEEGSGYDKLGFIVGKKSNNNYKYGYINFKGKRILENKYEQIQRIENVNQGDDVYLVAFENGKAGVYLNNKNFIKHEYEDIAFDLNNKCLILQKDSKQGIADLNGNIIIEIQYDNLYISGKYINAQKDGKIDIYDYSTRKRINFENIVGLNQITTDKYTIAITNEENYKILDNEKNELKEEEYKYLEYLYDDYFVAASDLNLNTKKEENIKFGIVDSNGNVIIDFKYDIIGKIGDTKIVQAFNEKKDSTDLIYEDKVITTVQNEEIYLNDNYILIQSDSDYKYVSLDGKIVDNTEVYDAELYAYKRGNKWGFIDKNGNEIVDAEYDFVTEFNEYGFAGIRKNGKWGAINIKGEIVVQPIYVIDSISPKFVGKYYEYNFGYGEPYYVCE